MTKVHVVKARFQFVTKKKNSKRLTIKWTINQRVYITDTNSLKYRRHFEFCFRK